MVLSIFPKENGESEPPRKKHTDTSRRSAIILACVPKVSETYNYIKALYPGTEL